MADQKQASHGPLTPTPRHYMAEKQASYGPPIPTPQHPHHHHHSTRGGCYSGWRCLMAISIAALIVLLAFLVCGLLLFRHVKKQINIHATNATLTEFDYTTNNTLHYNVAVNFTIFNPNKKMGVYYDKIDIMAYFEGHQLGSHAMTPFYEGAKNTSDLDVVFGGQQQITFEGDELTKYNEEKSNGVYRITFVFSLRVRFELNKDKTSSLDLKVGCNDLKIPLNGSVLPAGSNYRCNTIKFF